MNFNNSHEPTRDEVIYFLGLYLYQNHVMFDYDNADLNDAMKITEDELEILEKKLYRQAREQQ